MFNKLNQKCTYELIKVNNEPVIQPTIRFTSSVLCDFKALCDSVSGEIGWLAFADRDVENNSVLVYDVVLPKQEVSAVTTDLDEESLQDIAFSIMADRPEEFDNVRCWCHSHVNMQVNPSGTDDETFEQFYKDNDYFLRVICNKKGDMRVDFVDVKEQIKYDNCDFEIVETHHGLESIQKEIDELYEKIYELEKQLSNGKEELTNIAKDYWKEEVKNKVKNKTYTWSKKTNAKSYSIPETKSSWENFYENDTSDDDLYDYYYGMYNNQAEEEDEENIYNKYENNWKAMSEDEKEIFVTYNPIAIYIGDDTLDAYDYLGKNLLLECADASFTKDLPDVKKILVNHGFNIDDTDILDFVCSIEDAFLDSYFCSNILTEEDVK